VPEPRKYKDNAARQAAYRRRVEIARRNLLQQKGLPGAAPIATMPGHRRWQTAIKEAARLLEMVCEEMRTYYDDRSEIWRDGERGDAFLERLEAIEATAAELCDHQTG
jgi:hypothetical protein